MNVKSGILRCCSTVLAAGLLTACASTATTGSEFDAAAAEGLEVGVSSKTEILSVLGKPFQQTTNVDGSEMWIYEFSSSESRTTRAGMLGGYAVLAGLDTTKSTFSSQTLLLELNDEMLTHCLLSFVEGDKKGGIYGTGAIESATSGTRTHSVCAKGDAEQIPQWMRTQAGL